MNTLIEQELHLSKKESQFLCLLLNSKKPLVFNEIASKLDFNQRYLYQMKKKLEQENLIIIDDSNGIITAKSDWNIIKTKLCRKNKNLFLNTIKIPSQNHPLYGDTFHYLKLFNEGESFRLKGEHLSANLKYSKIIKEIDISNPIWDIAQYRQADLEYIHGEYDKALNKLNDILENGSNIQIIPVVFRGIAEIYNLIDDIDQAKSWLEFSLKSSFQSNNLNRVLENYNSLGQVYLLENPKIALKYIQKSEQLGKGNGELLIEYGKSYYLQAECWNQLKNFEKAKFCAEKSYHILKSIYKSGTIRAQMALAESIFHISKDLVAKDLIYQAVNYYETENIYKPFFLKSLELQEQFECKI